MHHHGRMLTCCCYRVHWPDHVVLVALLVTLVISETIPPVTRRIYHVGPDGAASALETWQCAALLQNPAATQSMPDCIKLAYSAAPAVQCLVPGVHGTLTGDVSSRPM
jgi:hypothetical protein